MPRKFPTFYPDYARQIRDDALFISALTGVVTVVLCAAAVSVSYAPAEPHSEIAVAFFGVGALVFGWLTGIKLKTAFAYHKRKRKRKRS